MKSSFPPIQPYKTHSLKVSDLHTIYVEESGNPDGLPVIFIHGGPGSGSTEADRCFFDPRVYRVIIFDQRGCSRSSPLAEIRENTTQDLVGDIEKIRNELGIKQWVVFGGSWGSTLGLVYAQTHPQRILGMILRGIFLAREEERKWLYGGGAGNIFPEYWHEFISYVPKEDRKDMPKAYHQYLNSSDTKVRMDAAKAWTLWEGRCTSLLPNTKVIEMLNEPNFALCFARISCHFYLNNCFLELNQILNNVSKLQGLPSIIIHGRYDILCPVENAYTLHHAWPGSDLNIVPGAGHVTSEPGILDALITATEQMSKKFL
jgi:proline iminopeptidase